MSNFGWTYLSREALRQAEIQLAGEQEGIRDEIGFLAIHQGYANRFFPGTSVLHTRLRYALFVPWIYQSLHKGQFRNGFDNALRSEELKLTKKLRAPNVEGVIGGRIYPKAASQPPSIVYWTALSTWGLLRARADGRLPTRAQMHAVVQHRSRSGLDDDGQPLFGAGLPFVSLPPPPENWDSDDSLAFTLRRSEATFLHSVITNIYAPTTNGFQGSSARKSLFARLAAAKKLDAFSCWDPAIVALAGDDAEALQRAGDAASLAAIGRSVYAALVETLCEQFDKRSLGATHRNHLPKIVEEHASRASRVELATLGDDIASRIPTSLVDVLRETLDWLASGAHNLMALHPVYERAECSRKGQRARLPNTLNGRDRRMEWDYEKHSRGEPLHYRWPNVSRLLSDLWEAA
jgi:hypothetical protein